MNFQSPLFTTAVDTAGTSAILLDKLPPSVIEQAPMMDQISHSWQAPVIAVASSVLIQLALKGAKFLIGLLSKKLSPKATL